MATGDTQARGGNFIEDGPINPFAGLAPALTPAEQAAQEQARIDARRERERLLGRQTANINNRPGGYMDGRETFNTNAIDPKTGQPYTGKERPDPGSFTSTILPTLDAIRKDPVTMSVLLAPYAVGAASALAPAAGAGATSPGSAALAAPYGPGGAYGASVPGGLASAYGAAPVAGVQATGTPFTMASPYAAGAAPAAGGAATAAAPSAIEQIGEGAQSIVKTGLTVAAPALINAAFGGRTKEEKQLLEKQAQLAQQAKVRQGQQQDARMNALGQQLLAFNPTNQVMAQMFGPDAAFSPEQMAQMTRGQPPPSINPSLENYQGTDPKKRAEVAEWVRRKKEFEASEAQRREMMMSNWQPPGPGPTPIQMPTPQAARRY